MVKVNHFIYVKVNHFIYLEVNHLYIMSCFLLEKKVVVHHFWQSSDVPRTSSWCNLFTHTWWTLSFSDPGATIKHLCKFDLDVRRGHLGTCGDCKGRVPKIPQKYPLIQVSELYYIAQIDAKMGYHIFEGFALRSLFVPSVWVGVIEWHQFFWS